MMVEVGRRRYRMGDEGFGSRYILVGPGGVSRKGRTLGYVQYL